ncbi:uncharacterized protein DS421_15g501080 [Arachis hypogaea]|nr:uncharacterized protein DS421_15g501080 [Arachis hypogaea]
MTTGSRGRSSRSRGRGRERASTESLRTVHSSPSTLTTPSTPVTSQAGPVDQQFIMVPNPNYVPPFATFLLLLRPPYRSSGRPGNVSTYYFNPFYPFSPNNDAYIQEITELKFIWDKEHDLMTRKIFDHWAGKPLQQMMSDICQRCNNLMIWIRPDIKKALETHFSIDEGFKLHRLTKVANRASPRSSSYTSGSATFMKTKSRLSKSLDRKSTLVETFKYTHTLKANKERFSDERRITRRDWRPRPNNLSRLVRTTLLAQRPQWVVLGQWHPLLCIGGFLYLCHQPCRSPESCRLEGRGAKADTEASSVGEAVRAQVQRPSCTRGKNYSLSLKPQGQAGAGRSFARANEGVQCADASSSSALLIGHISTYFAASVGCRRRR